MTAPQVYYTSGDIARELGREVGVVRFILSTRPIGFVGRAGPTRLYPKSAIEEVRTALSSLVTRRRRQSKVVTT